MKLNLTLLFLINLAISHAQIKHSSVIGQWKLISVDSGDFFLNTKTDSISFSKEFNELYTDSLKLKNFINVAKLTYNNYVMEFSENGDYTQNNYPEIKMVGKYKLIPSDSKIIVLLKDNVNWEMKYEIIESNLHLTTTLYDKKTEFVLEKILE